MYLIGIVLSMGNKTTTSEEQKTQVGKMAFSVIICCVHASAVV